MLNSAQQIAGWRSHARALQRALPAIVQIDTGMPRMGLAPPDVEAMLLDPHGLDGIVN